MDTALADSSRGLTGLGAYKPLPIRLPFSLLRKQKALLNLLPCKHPPYYVLTTHKVFIVIKNNGRIYRFFFHSSVRLRHVIPPLNVVAVCPWLGRQLA